jgi:hypothetical protein
MTRQALEDAVDVVAVMGGAGCRRDGNTDRLTKK